MSILKSIWVVLNSNIFKSFYWRSGMAALAFLIENVTSLGLPEFVVLGIGLALGEVSKQLNKAHQARKKEQETVKV